MKATFAAAAPELSPSSEAATGVVPSLASSKPDPEAMAVSLGLRLRPRAGARYTFDGRTIIYDLEQPLEAQRGCIARAVFVHLMTKRLRRAPRMSFDEAARRMFRLG